MDNPTILSVAIFFGLAFIAIAFGLLVRDLLFRRQTASERRLRSVTSAPERPLQPAATLAPDDTEPSLNPIRRITRAFVRLVNDSGVEMPPEAAQLLLLLCGLAIGGGLFLWHDDLLPALLGFTAGLVLPILWLLYRRASRLRTIQEQLPGALDLLVRAVRAGESLDQGIELVGNEVPNPLGDEFRRCAAQLHMGLSLHAAVRSLAQRVSLMEIRIFATTLMVHRQAGGNLALTLERVADVVRDRISYRRRFRAATSGGRFAAILIACLGAFAFTYMTIWEPDYLNAFFEDALGISMLIAAVVMQLVGLLTVAAMLRVDY